jgi:hypothetical protein
MLTVGNKKAQVIALQVEQADEHHVIRVSNCDLLSLYSALQLMSSSEDV